MKKLKKSLGRQANSRAFVPQSVSQGVSTVESTSSPESLSESESNEDSDYSSGSEEETEPEEPSPLPPNRPSDPSKAIEYDALKAVWAPRNKILSVAAIRTALGEFWIVVKGIRDKWKSESLDLQQAQQKKNQQKIAQLTRSVAEQRRLLESCIRLTLTHGHQDITEKYVKFLFCCNSCTLMSKPASPLSKRVYGGTSLTRFCQLDRKLAKLVKRPAFFKIHLQISTFARCPELHAQHSLSRISMKVLAPCVVSLRCWHDSK